jgi:hypothetical protein
MPEASGSVIHILKGCNFTEINPVQSNILSDFPFYKQFIYLYTGF